MNWQDWQDIVNAGFELFGCAAVSLSISKLWHDKKVAGVHWAMMAYFALWGWWNVYYYPHLDQIASTVAALAMAVTNLVYLGLLLRYRKR